MFFLSIYAIILKAKSGTRNISLATAPIEGTSPSDPYATPTLIITMLYHSTTAFYAYARYSRSDQSAFVLGAIGSGALAAMGLWVIMFGQSSHISERTGADKRTSGWPFRNTEADKKRVPKKVR
jgi:hypothetical protein